MPRSIGEVSDGDALAAPTGSGVPGLMQLLRTGATVDPSRSPFVEEIATQLMLERTALASEISAALRREIPAYGAIRDPARLAELLAVSEHLIAVFARILRSEPTLSSDEWEFVEHLGRRRAEEGFPLSAVVSAFHVGMNVGWEYTTRRVHHPTYSPEDATALMGIALQLLNFIGEVTQRISSAYSLLEVPAGVPESPSRVLVADFLAGAFLTEEDLDARSATFRAELKRPHAIVLIAGRVAEPVLASPAEHPPAQGPWVDAAERLVHRVDDALPVAVVSSPVPHAAVLVPAMNAARWVQLLDVCEKVGVEHGVTILAVPPVAGAVAIYQSYIDARESLGLARKVLQGHERVASVNDLQIYRVLQGRAEDRQLFVRCTLGPVLELKEQRRHTLIESLEAWFLSEGHYDEAARRLFVHPNTLRYRLRRVEELTGLSLRVPSQQVRLDLALHLLRLDADAPDS